MIDIDNLLYSAMKSRNDVEIQAYRNLKAEQEKFIHAQILDRKLTDEIQLRIIASYSKKLEDAIKQFSKAGRDDLVSEYTSELEVVRKLLPEPVDESEMYDELADWYAQFYKIVGNIEIMKIPKKEMRSAIKHLKSKFPTADGKMISEIVKKYIV